MSLIGSWEGAPETQTLGSLGMGSWVDPTENQMGKINLNLNKERGPFIPENPSGYALAVNKAPELDTTSVEKFILASWYDGSFIDGLSFTPTNKPTFWPFMTDPNLKPTIRNTSPAGSQRSLVLLCENGNSTLLTLTPSNCVYWIEPKCAGGQMERNVQPGQLQGWLCSQSPVAQPLQRFP